MKRSTNRILTTHVGSLIRPPALQEFLRLKQAGKPYDQIGYGKCLKDSVADVVAKQADVGIDVVSDGEFGKSISWSQYVLERLSGFERRPIRSVDKNPFTRGVDREKFAEFYAELDAREGVATTVEAVCVGPISYTGQAELKRDIENFKSALKDIKVEEAFLPVAAPASVIPDRKNEHYKSEEDLIRAIGARALPSPTIGWCRRNHLPITATGSRCKSRFSTRPSPVCQPIASAITSAGEAGRVRIRPTSRSRTLST
jgi:5-methyltetrahydropteroyltriglutamate--homocysteine methyltransferase